MKEMVYMNDVSLFTLVGQIEGGKLKNLIIDLTELYFQLFILGF